MARKNGRGEASKPRKRNPVPRSSTTKATPAIDRRKDDGNRVSQSHSRNDAETRAIPSPVPMSEEEYHKSPGFLKVQDFNNGRLKKYTEDFMNFSNAASDVGL